MADELSTTSSTTQLTQYEKNYLERKARLEKSGYYKSNITPDEYLQQKAKSRPNANLELEEAAKERLGKKFIPTTTTPTGKIDPEKHWGKYIQAKFEACDPDTQAAWKKSFTIIEKSYQKQTNQMQMALSIADPIVALLAPLANDLKKLGKTPAEYVSTLIQFDKELTKNPVYKIATLLSKFAITYDDLMQVQELADREVEQSFAINKYVEPLKKELSEIKKSMGYNPDDKIDSVEVEKTVEEVVEKISSFFAQVDEQGNSLYPHAEENIERILELAEQDIPLHDAYNQALSEANAEASPSSSSDDKIEFSQLPTSTYAVPKSDKRKMLEQAYQQIHKGY